MSHFQIMLVAMLLVAYGPSIAGALRASHLRRMRHYRR